MGSRRTPECHFTVLEGLASRRPTASSGSDRASPFRNHASPFSTRNLPNEANVKVYGFRGRTISAAKLPNEAKVNLYGCAATPTTRKLPNEATGQSAVSTEPGLLGNPSSDPRPNDYGPRTTDKKTKRTHSWSKLPHPLNLRGVSMLRF